MITKDTSGNADFIFGIDMNRLFLDNSAYSALITNMTDTAKMQIVAKSEILSFNITRRHVKRDLSLSHLASPLMPSVFNEEVIPQPVLNSIENMREVLISVSGQPNGMRYLTASDNGLSNQTAGTYQYELYISFVDGLVPTIDSLLKRLYAANNSISKYLALLDIPNNYDSETDSVNITIRDSDIKKISKVYVDALSYFRNLKNISKEYRRAASLINSSTTSKSSIGIFQKRLNTIISKVQEIASQTGTNISPSSVANKSANSGLTSPPIVEINHSFNNTISVECRDNKYIDYFKSADTSNTDAGINTYLYEKVKNSTPRTTYLEPPMSLLEMYATRGVTFTKQPLTIDTTAATGGLEIDTESFNGNNVENYTGLSATRVGGLLRDTLSPLDLSTVSLETDVSTLGAGAIGAALESTITPPASTSDRGVKEINSAHSKNPDE
jgi:hypothetical protein